MRTPVVEEVGSLTPRGRTLTMYKVLIENTAVGQTMYKVGWLTANKAVHLPLDNKRHIPGAFDQVGALVGGGDFLSIDP